MITGMRVTLKFSDNVRRERGADPIIPGGYTVRLNNGDEVYFDFSLTELVGHDGNTMSFSQKNIFSDLTDDMKNVKPEDIEEFTDFYVYIPEERNPERSAIIEVTELSISYTDENDVPQEFAFTDEFLRTIKPMHDPMI